MVTEKVLLEREITADDKSAHIDLKVTVQHPDLGEETVLIQIHANEMLLGVMGLNKVGKNENLILQLAAEYLTPDDDDDEWDEEWEDE
jgi:hypothetical protein